MTTVKNIFVFLFYTIISFSTWISFAQEKTIAQLQPELISPWLVTVEGEVRTRTLRITGAAQKPDGTLLLEAIYAWTDRWTEGQIALPASVSQSGQKNTMQFTTPISAQVVATQMSNGNFEGTITYTNGQTKAIKLQKLSEDELRLEVASAKTARAATIIVKPAVDVPASCAPFSGHWTGNWDQGYGQGWLWVASIDTKCMAKVSYVGSDRTPTSFETVEIKDGVLEWLCDKPKYGTCVFARNGDELRTNYWNFSGGRNRAVFKKVQ